MTDARIEQASLEQSAPAQPNAEILQAQLEFAGVAVPGARIQQALAETAFPGLPFARIDQALVEISIALPEDTLIPTIIFPDLASFPGLGWSIHRRPTHSTRVQTASSARSVRTPLYARPIYAFELTYDALNSGAENLQALLAESLQQIAGFYLQCQGQYAAFLFRDPDFNAETGALLGTGDGTSAVFPLMRSVGPYTEQIQAANVVSAVYLNGVEQSSGWAVVNGNQLQFTTAPANGASVTADFSYYFVCRFSDDVHDYEEFMQNLHTLQSCKIESVRTS